MPSESSIEYRDPKKARMDKACVVCGRAISQFSSKRCLECYRGEAREKYAQKLAAYEARKKALDEFIGDSIDVAEKSLPIGAKEIDTLKAEDFCSTSVGDKFLTSLAGALRVSRNARRNSFKVSQRKISTGKYLVTFLGKK